jgi:hypothetical protein
MLIPASRRRPGPPALDRVAGVEFALHDHQRLARSNDRGGWKNRGAVAKRFGILWLAPRGRKGRNDTRCEPTGPRVWIRRKPLHRSTEACRMSESALTAMLSSTLPPRVRALRSSIRFHASSRLLRGGSASSRRHCKPLATLLFISNSNVSAKRNYVYVQPTADAG